MAEVTCPTCEGSGRDTEHPAFGEPAAEAFPCQDCGGTGHAKPEPIVPGDLHILGKPARILLELDVGKGRRLTIPITDLSSWQRDHVGSAYGELRILIRDEFQARIYAAQRTMRKDFP